MQRDSRGQRDRRQEIEDALKKLQGHTNGQTAAHENPRSFKARAGTPPAPKPARQTGVIHPTPSRTVWRSTLADIPAETLCPLVDSWIYYGEHTVLVGPKTAGKSTFLAWLHAKVERSLLLTGKEESIGLSVASRLLAHGVDPAGVVLLRAQDWRLPEHLSDLIAEVRRVHARLVSIDPLDSLLPDSIHENDHTGVRAFLEALQELASQTGAVVISVRHPGKGLFNPFPGSRAWQTVPRRVVRFHLDTGTPPKRYLSVETDHIGVLPSATYFHLDQQAGKPALFRWGEPVSKAEEEVASGTSDPRERRKLVDAKLLVRTLLSEGKKGAGWCLAEGEKLGFMKTTMHDAANLLNVSKTSRWDGGSLVHSWEKPAEWPAD